MATGAALLVLGGAWLVWTRRSTKPHPGGPHRLENLCGTDATSAFTAQHSSNEKAQERLSGFLLGPLE